MVKKQFWLRGILLLLAVPFLAACREDCGYDCDPRIDEAQDAYFESLAEEAAIEDRLERYDEISDWRDELDDRIEREFGSGYPNSGDYSGSSSGSSTFGCPQGCTYHKAGCDIKGNISIETGEKIFHVPGQEYYSETIIRSEYGERWFCTAREARANGWRKSKR